MDMTGCSGGATAFVTSFGRIPMQDSDSAAPPTPAGVVASHIVVARGTASRHLYDAQLPRKPAHDRTVHESRDRPRSMPFSRFLLTHQTAHARWPFRTHEGNNALRAQRCNSTP